MVTVFVATLRPVALTAGFDGTFFNAGAARNVLLGALGVSFLRRVVVDDNSAAS